jgi:bacillithiol biosynthesis cysteine-adding enzyme BshC
MDFLDYRSLPATAGGFSDLFLDYVLNYRKVAQFFPGDFQDPSALEAAIAVASGGDRDRDALADVLEEQNRGFGSTPRAFANIALLRRPSTVAVVTGQQVGLFGGPLYTIFKTVTALKLSAYLKSQFPASDFVPVFWLEGEDHDFEEMNHVSVFNAENSLARVEYLHGEAAPERNLGPVGELIFNEALTHTLESLQGSLQHTEYTSPLLERVRAHYRIGKSFNHAFAGWINTLLGEQGLVFISSNDLRLKSLLAPLFEQEILTHPKTSQLVITQSAELEKEYHAQVKAKSLNLFLFHKGGRYLIEPREADFSLKGTRHFIPKDELPRMAREHPELFSPNVVLRPLCQDKLLPTVAYVAGPAEVAYHAQLRPVYAHFGVDQPIIFPRASASILEERVRRAMDKYSLELLEFFGDLHKVTSKVVEQIAEVKLDQIFASSSRRIHESLTELRFGLNEVDPTLLGALDNSVGKIDQNIALLKEKAMAAQKRRNEAAVRQVERSANALLPAGGLQERELNILYFMNKYGPELIQRISSDLDIHAFSHQILTV